VALDPLAQPGFGGDLRSALTYERGRPGYPSALADALAAEFGLDADSRVLDLAAGTGQLSRLLVPLVGSVVAVEPSAPMRDVLARGLPGVEALAGRAERIPLPDQSVDAAVVGNAFHWFDGDAAVGELARVLRPGGGLAVLWNLGLSSDPPWSKRLEQLVEELSANALRPARRCTSGMWRPALDRAHDLFEPLRFSAFDHERSLDHEAFVAGIASFSFIAAMPDAERDRVLTEVRALAPEECALSMRTECYLTRRRTGPRYAASGSTPR
jgi:ubiquinone/menaquinone biosynthesis C-methylase UbiE